MNGLRKVGKTMYTIVPRHRMHLRLGMLLSDIPISFTSQMRSDLEFTIHRSFAWGFGFLRFGRRTCFGCWW